MPGFFDLLSYGIFINLIFTVWGRAKKVVYVTGILSLFQAFTLSVAAHLLVIFCASMFSAISAGNFDSFVSNFNSPLLFFFSKKVGGEENDNDDDSTTQNFASSSGRKAGDEYPFQLSAFSITLFAFTILLFQFTIEAAAWLKSTFVPMLKSFRYFYFKTAHMQPVTHVQSPGVDLRGKVLNV